MSEKKITTHPELIIKLRSELEGLTGNLRIRTKRLVGELIEKMGEPYPLKRFSIPDGNPEIPEGNPEIPEGNPEIPDCIASDGSSHPIDVKSNVGFLISAVCKRYLRNAKIFKIHSIPFEGNLLTARRYRLVDIIRETLRLEIIFEFFEKYSVFKPDEFLMMIDGPVAIRYASIPTSGDSLIYLDWFERYCNALKKLYELSRRNIIFGFVKAAESKFFIRALGMRTGLTDVSLLDEVLPTKTCYPWPPQKIILHKMQKRVRDVPSPTYTYVKMVDMKPPFRIDFYGSEDTAWKAMHFIAKFRNPITGIPFPIEEAHNECVISKRLTKDLSREFGLWI